MFISFLKLNLSLLLQYCHWFELIVSGINLIFEWLVWRSFGVAWNAWILQMEIWIFSKRPLWMARCLGIFLPPSWWRSCEESARSRLGRMFLFTIVYIERWIECDLHWVRDNWSVFSGAKVKIIVKLITVPPSITTHPYRITYIECNRKTPLAMADPGQKGVEFLEEAQKKLRNSQGFISSFFGYDSFRSNYQWRWFFFSAEEDRKSMKPPISMFVLLIRSKWLNDGMVIRNWWSGKL